MREARSYYAVRCRLDGAEWFFVWYSGEPDGVLLSSSSARLMLFSDLAEMSRYASEQRLDLEPETPAFYDFDRLAEWLSQPARELDCVFLLDAWNMLGDLAASLGARRAEPAYASGIYDKLFWGSNLPSVTPPGERFVPVWSENEISTLTSVLSSALQVLQDAACRT